jgi:hypothetical protein
VIKGTVAAGFAVNNLMMYPARSPVRTHLMRTFVNTRRLNH